MKKEDELIIIDIKLGIWICSSRGSICNVDEVLAQDIIEDITFQSSRFAEHFVDNVPRINLPLVLGHLGSDVCLQYGCQCGRACDGRDPRWKLGVPN